MLESSGREFRPDDFCLQLILAGWMPREDGVIVNVPGEDIFNYDCTMFLRGNPWEFINFADWPGVIVWLQAALLSSWPPMHGMNAFIVA